MNLKENPNDSDAKIFVDFYFRELKDLAKHFLTLVAGTLVLTVTFVEKFVNPSTSDALHLWLMGLCWFFLVVSFLLCGIGLFRLFIAAEKAMGSVIFDYQGDFKSLARKAELFFDLAAISYGMALVLLALTGFLRLLRL